MSIIQKYTQQQSTKHKNLFVLELKSSSFSSTSQYTFMDHGKKPDLQYDDKNDCKNKCVFL